MSTIDDMAKAINEIRALGPTMVRVEMHRDDIETLRTTIPTRPVKDGWHYEVGVPIVPEGDHRGLAMVHYSDGSTAEVELVKGAATRRDAMVERFKALTGWI